MGKCDNSGPARLLSLRKLGEGDGENKEAGCRILIGCPHIELDGFQNRKTSTCVSPEMGNRNLLGELGLERRWKIGT